MSEGSRGQLEGETASIYLPPFRIDVTVRPGAARPAAAGREVGGPNAAEPGRPGPSVAEAGVARPALAVPVSRRRIAAAVRAALVAAGAPGPSSISVVLSDDLELAELNATHMGHSGPTDVLSFPFLPPEAFPDHERDGASRDRGAAAVLKQAFALPPALRVHLGDMIVSVDRAATQAGEGLGGQTGTVRWTAAEELLLLVVHGTLHICGWDHAAPSEETAMRTLERKILAGLGAAS